MHVHGGLATPTFITGIDRCSILISFWRSYTISSSSLSSAFCFRNSWWCGAAWTSPPLGFSRAIFAAKGWEYYAHNAFFWAKIGTFLVIGLLSVPPTLAFLKWRRAGASPTNEAVAKARRYLWMEVALFPLLPAFAAAMARGYGEF
jgi:hypothetical protein